MAGNRPPKPTPAPTQPEDPLADLRDGTTPGDPLPPIGPEAYPPGAVDLPQDGSELEGVEMRPMVSQELWDEMVAETVAAWHADPTSLGFLHGGGSICGCAFIARTGLRAAVPVAILDETEETVLTEVPE